MRRFATLCAGLGLSLALIPVASAAPDAARDLLARDIASTESVRAVKNLQYSFAQYAQFGLWDQAGALFAPDATLVFDGQVKPAETVQGPAAIAAWLRTRYGGGTDGLAADGLSTLMVENPLVNLAPDGASAKARWDVLIFHGHGGDARIEGGVFENDYVRQSGTWKIATLHYYPQFDGPYAAGWANWGGGDLPIAPHHYDVRTAGIPIPPMSGPAPASDAPLAALRARADRLNDEDRIRNLQAMLGFYADRRMWDDVADLFARDGAVEIGRQGVWRGSAGIRHWLASQGPAGLRHGQLDDRVQFDMTVTIAPGGNEAFARGIELGMLGEADQEKGWWEVDVFQNRFVKDHGVWKLRELRRFPLMKTDIFQGWGKSRIVDPAPRGADKPDPLPAGDAAAPGLAMPAFLASNPVTGAPIVALGAATRVATRPLTGAIAAARPAAPVGLAEIRRRLARSAAWDGVMNVSAAYGYYLDDGDAAGFAGVMAEKGFKESPFAGYYITRDRITQARVSGPLPQLRGGISYHWLIQPALLISDDGRSAMGHIRLFQPRTGKTVAGSRPGDLFSASFGGGIYHDRYVLENGVWRIWELTLDEPYIDPVSWTDGLWAKAKDPPPGTRPRAFPGGNFPPDVPLTALGKREEHFRGGTGAPWQWPTILPMWFDYTNPVSGRVPPLYQRDCVPCTLRPELRLDRNGYQQTPDAPAANRAP